MADMVKVFVVERQPISQNPADADLWLSVGTFKTEAAAVESAKGLRHTLGTLNKNVRVRQFWLQSQLELPLQPVLAKPPSAVNVPMTEYACQEHQTTWARVFTGSNAPKCPDCGKPMLPLSFLEAAKELWK